ncbi:MAG: hypothetical protein A2176_05570 [Spirochaetes bacterium RBG_13_51_14]|nr:MAG: hypothetical protein A2176_05570 [Spirochaetes bacterium RBG_13_51_14]
MNSFQKKLLAGLIVLAVVAPVGIFLPAAFNAGDAWGEWSTETLEKMIGFIPAGLKKTADLWKAPIPDYNLGDEKSSFTTQALSYILSGAVGIALCALILYLLSRFLFKKDD